MQASWFGGEEHRAFSVGADSSSVLLLHGFMGSPAEMRPLGDLFASNGFQANGPLLPGFGEDIASLNKLSRADWLCAAEDQWTRTRARGGQSVLLGYSMGGALAIHLAHRHPPDLLILLAPLWKLLGGDPKLHVLPIVKHVVSTIKPFARTDFDDPEIQQFFKDAMPELDLADPAVQQNLREEVSISTSTVDELRRLADEAAELVGDISVPTLVIQGIDDTSVRAVHTRTLVGRMGRNARLIELPADHMLTWPGKECWPQVRETVLDFVRGGD